MDLPVVVGVDGSPQSLAAADWAAEEAALRGRGLRLVHAAPLRPRLVRGVRDLKAGQQRARRMLARAAERVRAGHPGLPVGTDQLYDAPASALVAAGAEADLLVLGSRYPGGLTARLTGAVALQVAARSDCPLVLVRPPGARGAAGAGPRDGPGEVVVGVNVRRPSAPVVAFAVAEAARRGAVLRAVYAAALLGGPVPGGPVPGGPETGGGVRPPDEGDGGALAEALRVWRYRMPQVPVVTQVVRGSPGTALPAAASGAVLVVVGRSSAGASSGPRLGPVARSVVQQAVCPVAVVPHAG